MERSRLAIILAFSYSTYTVVDRVVKYMYLPTVGYDHSDVG